VVVTIAKHWWSYMLFNRPPVGESCSGEYVQTLVILHVVHQTASWRVMWWLLFQTLVVLHVVQSDRQLESHVVVTMSKHWWSYMLFTRPPVR